ncbi:hypothetical protein [Pantoea stewartii]|uniref:hypothetical protein n=1 Tax=Pantoea stewartii TaxID=66269 RepID=UPI000AEA6333|nr:hypothetical protein [Pantoea stewartii]
MNLKEADNTLRKHRKQLSRICMMNRMWLNGKTAYQETWAVWKITAGIIFFNLIVFLGGQNNPELQTVGLVSVVLSGVLWLRWKKKPHNWSDLITAELASYSPTDQDAFVRLQETISHEGHTDPHLLDRWISHENRNLTRKEFAHFRKMENDTEDRHHDDAKQP